MVLLIKQKNQQKQKSKKEKIMVFGLGTKKVQKETKANTKTQHANTSQADEAAEMLKKMEAKKDAGDCPFC